MFDRRSRRVFQDRFVRDMNLPQLLVRLMLQPWIVGESLRIPDLEKVLYGFLHFLDRGAGGKAYSPERAVLVHHWDSRVSDEMG